jgi:hypothetical protein
MPVFMMPIFMDVLMSMSLRLVAVLMAVMGMRFRIVAVLMLMLVLVMAAHCSLLLSRLIVFILITWAFLVKVPPQVIRSGGDNLMTKSVDKKSNRARSLSLGRSMRGVAAG